MTTENNVILQIENLDLVVRPRGSFRKRKESFTVLPQQGLSCVAGCDGGTPLPEGCPLTGKVIKASMGGTILTDEATIDKQLESAYCVRVDIPAIIEKFGRTEVN